MLRALAIPAAFAFAALTAAAQHTASPGFAPAHVSGAIARPSGSFSRPSAPPKTFNTTPRYQWNTSHALNSPAYSSPTGPAPFGAAYPPGERAGGGQYPYHHDHDGHRPVYPRGVYLYPGYLASGFWGYPGLGYDDSGDSAAPDAAGNGQAQAPYPGYPYPGYPDDYAQAAPPPAPPRPEYQSQAEPSAPQAPLPDQPETVLIFKDRRPSQQVQSYALTTTTLYVLDGARRREIPIDQIDVSATEKINREAGVDFNLPAGLY